MISKMNMDEDISQQNGSKDVDHEDHRQGNRIWTPCSFRMYLPKDFIMIPLNKNY